MDGNKTCAFSGEALDSHFLHERGLNLQAVLDLQTLPQTLKPDTARGDHRGQQLIVVGHGGGALWQQLNRRGLGGEHPIDHYTLETLAEWFAKELPGRSYRVLYPGDSAPSLQGLGQLLGWHHPSPFKVGINSTWGSWFAYRAVLLADTRFRPTLPVSTASPCSRCEQRVCIPSCPANALDQGRFQLDRCLAYRQGPGSQCRNRCLARNACPVGAEHRYSDQQIHYHYRQSLKLIERV